MNAVARAQLTFSMLNLRQNICLPNLFICCYHNCLSIWFSHSPSPHVCLSVCMYVCTSVRPFVFSNNPPNSTSPCIPPRSPDINQTYFVWPSWDEDCPRSTPGCNENKHKLVVVELVYAGNPATHACILKTYMVAEFDPHSHFKLIYIHTHGSPFTNMV